VSFSREFFERFDTHIEEYRELFWTGSVTVTLKVYEREINVKRLVQCGDELLTFAYYDPAKQRELPAKVREETGETDAFPVLTIPYGAILWVELNPGKAPGRHDDLGFRFEDK
jgi:hypothetical protein